MVVLTLGTVALVVAVVIFIVEETTVVLILGEAVLGFEAVKIDDINGSASSSARDETKERVSSSMIDTLEVMIFKMSLSD